MHENKSNESKLDPFEKEYDNEKTFFQVAWKSICYFFNSKRKNLIFYFFLFVLSCYLGWLIIINPGTINLSKDIFSIAVSITTSLLGFLIAGFAIYTALSDKDLVYILMNYKEEINSQFHINNLYFYEPFVFFGLAFCFSLIGYIFTLIWGSIIYYLPRISLYLGYFSLLYGIYFFIIFLCLISLKDFIFNVYSVSIMMGRIEFRRRKSNLSIDKIVEIMTQNNKTEE